MQAVPAAHLAQQSSLQVARPPPCAKPVSYTVQGQPSAQWTQQPAGSYPTSLSGATPVISRQTISYSARTARPYGSGTLVASSPSSVSSLGLQESPGTPMHEARSTRNASLILGSHARPISVTTVTAPPCHGSSLAGQCASYAAGRPAPADAYQTHQQMPSFTPMYKSTSQPCAPAQLQIIAGGYTQCGQKACAPGQPNQDTYLAVPLGPGLMLAGVLDGHGKRGHLVSAYVCKIFEGCAQQFAALSASEVPHAFIKIFNVAQEGLVREGLADMAGTTATLALINANAGTVTAAHVGDSTLAVFAGPNLTCCTKDHVVDDEVERYVLAHGGEVYATTFGGITAKRIYPPGEDAVGLAMARALGHSELVPLVRTVPEVTTARFGADCTLVVASDGIWEKMSKDSVAALVAGATPIMNNAQAETFARALVTEARGRWPSPPEGDVDDITAVVVRAVP